MKQEYSDEDLTAFLDGAIAADVAAKINAAAKVDATLARRIEALTVDTDILKTAYEPMLGVAHARSLMHKLECARSHEIANRSNRPTGLLTAASYAAAIVIGAVLSWIFLSPKTDWRVEVAHYQALYVPATLNSVAPDMPRLQTEFTRASSAVGLALDPLAFSDLEGLQLRRAQVLGFDDAPLVQIAFTLADGTPVAFCILQQSGNKSALEPDTLIGLAAASWSTATHRFLAIGGDNTSDILALAQHLEKRL